jgi:hypothetical protein
MSITSSPPKSGRGAPCTARNRSAQALILSSVLALGMAFDACAQESQPAAAPKGSPATQPADGPDLADIPVGMTSLDGFEIVMSVDQTALQLDTDGLENRRPTRVAGLETWSVECSI